MSYQLNIMVVFVSMALCLGSITSHADEYGERFYNQTPKGMADFTANPHEIPDIAMDEIADSLQDIMPAAGDESTDVPVDEQDIHSDTIDPSVELLE